MSQMTAIPVQSLRITMGSRELKPSQVKLVDGGCDYHIITLKMRLLGGVGPTKQRNWPIYPN